MYVGVYCSQALYFSTQNTEACEQSNAGGGEGRGGDSLSLCSSGAKATERLTVIRACFPGTNFSKGG